MEEAKVIHLPFGGYGRELARELRLGIQAELAASTDDERVALTQGRIAGTVGGRTCWSFAAPLDPSNTPAAETPARLWTPDGQEFAATVIAIGDESVTLTLDGEPDGGLEEAELRVDTSFVLMRLGNRIDELEATGGDPVLIDELLRTRADRCYAGLHRSR